MRITQLVNPIAVFVRRLFRCYRPEMSRFAALAESAKHWNKYAQATNEIIQLQSALQKEKRAREELHAHKLNAIVGIGALERILTLEHKIKEAQKSIGNISES